MDDMQSVSRLITQFVPEKYQLSLTLDRPGRAFSGIITMHGNSPEANDKIIVHAKDLLVTSATIDGKEAEFSTGSHDELTLSHPDIITGNHIVVIEFSGTITDAMHGLYPCYYDHDGVKKELLATQFESHHAREVFPCIDEPEAKAVFDVTLTTERGIVVLGNMPVRRQTVENDHLVTTFDLTPRMSTYLLAWVTGELHKKTARTKDNVEVNIWATVAQPLKNLDFALEEAVKDIEFFNNYFKTPYPLPKSDHIALPDFTSGAMENWGLITYREISLLADPDTASISSKQYIATVIAHELSHQWFGNLVTMRWWNDLWLNESFATLMEYVAVDALHPDWNMWLDFSTIETLFALRRDGIDGVQPVQTDVHHPDEISTLFDGAIVYAKGARLMRMLRQYIGNEAFQKGLRAYFDTHAYKNTEGNDLWQALGDASGKDVAGFMNTWISQPGYPVLHVADKGDELELSQKQFFIGPHADSDRLWPIPLNASIPNLPVMLDTKSTTVKRGDVTAIRFNVGDTAHFITQYDESLLLPLVYNIASLAPLDRLQLLHEQTLLARAGMIKTETLLPLLDHYKNESDESVWSIIAVAISELKKFVQTDNTSEQQLRRFAARIAYNQYERLGWEPQENESESDAKLRATIISLMLYGEHPQAIKKAIGLYKSTPFEEVDPELRSLITSAIVRYGDDPSIVDQLIERYRKTNAANLKEDLVAGLTASKDPVQLQKLLDLIPDETTIRPQDVVRWYVSLLRNRDGRALTWAWLQKNWPWVEKKFSGDKSYDDFPRYTAALLLTREQLEEYRAFFGPMKNHPALERVITMGISDIEGRVVLIERDSDGVRAALTKL
jgi:aminopeptidase N